MHVVYYVLAKLSFTVTYDTDICVQASTGKNVSLFMKSEMAACVACMEHSMRCQLTKKDPVSKRSCALRCRSHLYM